MAFTIFSSKSVDGSNLFLGDNNETWFSYNVDDFSQQDLDLYNNIFNLLGNFSYINILNCPYELCSFRVINDNVSDDIIEMDYESLSQNEKDIITDGYNKLFV
jgi:hypothetical protein